MRRKISFVLAISVLLCLAWPATALAADGDQTAHQAAGVGADTVWVIVAAVLVMFMQAGFAMLEVGYSRMKNVGTVVAKVITNFSVASIAYWGVGFALAFGATATWLFPVIGFSGFFPTFRPGSVMDLPAMGASAAPAAAGLLLLGPRIGKYARPRKPNIIPGHNMPLAQLGVLILWFGWFGFNPGSTLNATNLHFADIVITTNLAAAGGAIAALLTVWLRTRALDVGMIGNGAIAALVAITAPSGYVEPWAALVIGAVAGVIVWFGVYAIDKYLDDPVGS